MRVRVDFSVNLGLKGLLRLGLISGLRVRDGFGVGVDFRVTFDFRILRTDMLK